MLIGPPLRQAGSLKGNSQGCRETGIKQAWEVQAIMHGDNSNKLAARAHHHNRSLVAGAYSLLLHNNLVAGVRKPTLSSNRPILGVARVSPSNNLRPGVTRAPVPHLEVLAREE